MQKRISELNQKLDAVRASISEVIVGQSELIDKLLNALLCNGHVLLEGVPGVAKTLMVNSLAKAFDASFNRIQFTPDLLPGDVVGTQIYRDGRFETEKGPVFANLVLADEINRAPAKVQSALLEAMQERQVTLGPQTHRLPEPFMVMATQNPVEQEGTYALPEAQVDRFIFKLMVDYPSLEDEHTILKRMAKSAPKTTVRKAASLEDIVELRRLIDEVHVDETIERYILRLVGATRDPAAYGLEALAGYIRYGASPRASIFLALAARGHALLRGSEFVVPDDVKSVLHDVVRHRIAISYRAEAEGLHSEALLDRIVAHVSINEKG